MIKFNISITIQLGQYQNADRATKNGWSRLRSFVKDRDEETCQYCGNKALDGEPDHILPLARGGADTVNNLVWACRKCNRSKSDKTPLEWLKSSGDLTPPVRPEPETIPIMHRASNEEDIIDL